MSGVLLLTLFHFSSFGQQTPVSFLEVWAEIQKKSPVIEAQNLELDAAKTSYQRSRRHWVPQAYLDIKSYRTNDPGASFFGLMQQRSLVNTDFNPESINRPDAQTFSRGAVGLHLPFYEGGFKSAQADVLKHGLNSQEKLTLQSKRDQYAMALEMYGATMILNQQKSKLSDLYESTQKLVKKYQLGQKSNPVGYSGYLGLKSLVHRILGFQKHYQAMEQSYIGSLSEFGYKHNNWRPEVMSALNYVKIYSLSENDKSDVSYRAESMMDQVKAMENTVPMERARFLPRVGAFVEGYAFNGDRKTSDGYMAGVYLQWNILNASDIGAVHEAKSRVMAMEKKNQAYLEQERAERQSLIASIDSLKSNVDLINESYKNLQEQIKVTATLFQNGSISALQMTEVLNRQLDLILRQTEVEMSLVKSSAEIYRRQKSEAGTRVQGESK